MGAGSSSADITSLKKQVGDLQTKTSDYAAIKDQLKNVSSALAGSIEYDKLAQKLTETSSYNQKIAEAISKSPELGSNVSKTLYANPEAVKGIWTGLSGDTVFAKTLSNILTDEKQGVFKEALKGDKGPQGTIGANTLDAKRSLYDKPKDDPNAKAGYTMWCADGGLCKLPVDSTGIQWSNADGTVKGGSKIYEDAELNIETDNIIRFKTSMGGNKTPMEINTGGAVVNGDLEVKGKINIAGWTIEKGGDDSLVFRRGDATDVEDKPYLRMARDGNFWISRKTARGWVANNIEELNNKTKNLETKTKNLTEDRINIAGWKIEGGPDNSLVFRRGDANDGENKPYLRMAQDGNFWVSRSTARGWVPDNIQTLNNKTKNLTEDSINIAGWKVEGGPDNSLVFRRGNATGEKDQPYLRMAQDGNFWVSRSTARGWVPDNIRNHQHQFRQYHAAHADEGTTWNTSKI